MAQPRMKVAPCQPTYVELLRALKRTTEFIDELESEGELWFVSQDQRLKDAKEVIKRAEEWL